MCLLLTAQTACMSAWACVCVRARVCREMKEKCRVFFSIIKRELHCGAPKACEKLNSTDSNCPISTSKEMRR